MTKNLVGFLFIDIYLPIFTLIISSVKQDVCDFVIKLLAKLFCRHYMLNIRRETIIYL